MGKFIMYRSAFHIPITIIIFCFDSKSFATFYTEKIDAGFEPLQRWKKCVLCIKDMPWCYFCCSEKYCHPCITGFHSCKRAAVARRTSQQKAVGKLPTKVCGFGSDWLPAGGWGAQSGNQVMAKEFRAGREWDGWQGVERRVVWRFVSFWNASTIREEIDREHNCAATGEWEQARGESVFLKVCIKWSF